MKHIVILMICFTPIIINCQSFNKLSIDTLLVNCDDDSVKPEYIVIDFWATWCKPCIRSIPHFNNVIENNTYDQIKFISISNESPERILKFMEKNEMKGCVGIDNDFSLLHSFDYEMLPQAIIINARGESIWEGKPLELSNSLLENIVENKKIEERKENKVFFELLGPPAQTDSSKIGVSWDNSLYFVNQPLSNIHRNLLQWIHKYKVEIDYIGVPKYGYNYNCSCSVDTTNYTEKQFYQYCLNSLNSALGIDLIEKVNKVEKLTVESVDSLVLSGYPSEQDTVSIDINEEYIQFINVHLSDIIQALSKTYDVKHVMNYSIFKKCEEYNCKLSFSINKVDKSVLSNELQKVGIHAQFKMVKDTSYTIVYKE